MTTNAILISNITPEELSEMIRSIIREEMSLLAPNETKSPYLSRQEVASLLKISLPTLNQYTRTGVIKGSRVGSRVLYLESDIREAIKDIPTLKYYRG